MNLFLMRVLKAKDSSEKATYIFAIDHYITSTDNGDDYSKSLIYFYKYGNNKQFFVDQLKLLYDLRFNGDQIKFDYLTLYPTRNKGILNQNMENLTKELSTLIGLSYNPILVRNKDIKPQHELNHEERKANVEGSIDITEPVSGKNIIIIDNTSTTGISLKSVSDLLYKNGASNVACLCLGIGDKGKISDWNDLNKTLKYSSIIKKIKGPHVPKEKMEEWKRTNSKN